MDVTHEAKAGEDGGVIRIGTGRRIIGWLLLIAWLPVFVESCCTHLFNIEEKLPDTWYLITAFRFFVSEPLTAIAVMLTLYAGLCVLRRKEFKLHD
jgi:hypothetical protein